MRKRSAHLILILGLASRRSLACDVCDGLAASKAASGEVLEISHEGLLRLAPAHDLSVLLLYRRWDERSTTLQRSLR